MPDRREASRRPGRPLSSPDGHLRAWQIRITDRQRLAYVRAAERAGLTVSAWARRHLDRAAEG